jgi:hypothetical protein
MRCIIGIRSATNDIAAHFAGPHSTARRIKSRNDCLRRRGGRNQIYSTRIPVDALDMSRNALLRPARHKYFKRLVMLRVDHSYAVDDDNELRHIRPIEKFGIPIQKNEAQRLSL